MNENAERFKRLGSNGWYHCSMGAYATTGQLIRS